MDSDKEHPIYQMILMAQDTAAPAAATQDLAQL
jgi:hypothetical protein